MLASKETIGACVHNGVPCRLLVGYYTQEEWAKWYPDKPYQAPNVGCTIGYECGRGMCFRYNGGKDNVK